MENSEDLPHHDSVHVVTQLTHRLLSEGFRLSEEKPSICFLSTVSRVSLEDALAAYESGMRYSWPNYFASLFMLFAHFFVFSLINYSTLKLFKIIANNYGQCKLKLWPGQVTASQTRIPLGRNPSS